MNSGVEIFVKSHIARDLLQTAGLFGDVPKAVWEYVVNGLEYVDPGTNPVIRVTVEKANRRITVSDNGRGMNLDGLRNYFVLHGENIDRKAGRPGRGRFGTGKSAAFGIAESLRVLTVRSGKRCVAALSKKDIKEHQGGDQIPVRLTEQETPTDQAKSTVVQIDGVNQRAIDVEQVVRFFERQLCFCARNARVFVNNHECITPQPAVRFERKFSPDADTKAVIGDGPLTVIVSKGYLEEHQRGIAIYCRGVLHEIRPVPSNSYILGSIDVPYLDSKTFAIPPFDASRSLKLNQNNPLVQGIHQFIDSCVKLVCDEYKELERLKRKNEEAQKLDQLGSQISRILNRHFESLRNRPPKRRLSDHTGIEDGNLVTPSNGLSVALSIGGEIPAVVVPRPLDSTLRPSTKENADIKESKKSDPMSKLAESATGTEGAHVKPGDEKQSPKKSGGFRVQYQNAGHEADRATYASDERTIFVNLDHPQLEAALKGGTVETPSFIRLVNEITCAEYSIALTRERQQAGEYLSPAEPIEEIRETINWLARETSG